MRAHMPMMAVAIAAMPLTAAPAQESNGAARIVSGDYQAAEREIDQQRRFAPDDVDLLANLAAVYRHTGRESDARVLYRQILAQPDEPLDLAGRHAIASHALAMQALASLDRTLASR